MTSQPCESPPVGPIPRGSMATVRSQPWTSGVARAYVLPHETAVHLSKRAAAREFNDLTGYVTGNLPAGRENAVTVTAASVVQCTRFFDSR